MCKRDHNKNSSLMHKCNYRLHLVHSTVCWDIIIINIIIILIIWQNSAENSKKKVSAYKFRISRHVEFVRCEIDRCEIVCLWLMLSSLFCYRNNVPSFGVSHFYPVGRPLSVTISDGIFFFILLPWNHIARLVMITHTH